MNFLSIFVLIPLLMLAGLWAARGIKAIRGVMVTGASALLIASVVLTFMYLGERSAGNTAEMLFRADTVWYAPLNIAYSVGVDGISVAMLLLSAIIVFTGTFASWRLQPLTKEYFLWFTLLSMGVFGFFISIDLFTMFMFYEIALIPMYLLIGVWGSGRKEYAAMKLTLMLMGGSAFLLIGILGIYFGSGATTMNLLEIAQLHNIPFAQQCIWFPLTFLGFGVLGALFPFHTWSPDGHASAPTAVSMLHAGVLMKLGGYGCFRIAMYLMPEAANELSWIFLILTGISVVYGAFSACVQTGTFCHSDAESDSRNRSHSSDAFPRIDDSLVLRPDRYDLRTYAYPRCPRTCRVNESDAVPQRLLCDCRSCQSRFAGLKWIHC